MVQEDSFVTLEQEPVLNFTDCCFFNLRLLIFLGDGFIQILILRLRRLCWSHNRGQLLLFFIILFGYLDLLDNLLILEIDLIHLLGHFQLIFWKQFSSFHTLFDITLDFFFDKEFVVKNLLPWDSFLRLKSQHFFNQALKLFILELLREFNGLFIYFGNEFLKRCSFVRSTTIEHLVKDDTHGPNVTFRWIRVTVQNLWAHVHGTADQGLMDLV